MKFLCLSDYRGASQYLSFIPEIVKTEEPDIIFYCGNSMKGEKKQEEYETARKFHSKPDPGMPAIREERVQDMEYLQQFLLALADTQKTVYVIPGYNDAPEADYFKTVYNYAHIYPEFRPAHETMYREDAFMVAGFGGDLTLSEDNREFVLQYSKTWVEFALRRLAYFPGEKIMLFHSPPVSRLDLSNGEHCGVLLVNELIEKLNPQLVFCGRAVSGQGVVKMGSAVVVNPGPFFEGRYAVIDHPSMKVEFKKVQ